METLAKVQNVDEVLNAHSRFLENCLRSGQLSTKDIFRIIHKILLVVSQFVNFLNQTFAQVEQLSALIGTTDFDENMERLFGEHFQEQVRLHDKSFSDKIKRLIVELENIQTKETSDSIMNLLLKLDYNRYYGHFPATRA